MKFEFVAAVLLASGILIFSGCVQEKSEQQMYTCSSENKVSNPNLCPELTNSSAETNNEIQVNIVTADQNSPLQTTNKLACINECCSENQDPQYTEKPCPTGKTCYLGLCYATCGDNVCQDGESIFCLDCPIKCESNQCDGKIDVKCPNCGPEQASDLQKEYENDKLVYSCLSNFFNYAPPRIIPIEIDLTHEPCQTICETYGLAMGYKIKRSTFAGTLATGESYQSNPDKVVPEVHEMTHVFTQYMLDQVPSWFNEGISIYLAGNIKCAPNQSYEFNWSDSAKYRYSLFKSGQSGYSFNPTNEHEVGTYFFMALEQEYGCNQNCFLNIIKKLKEYKDQCIGDCLEEAQRRTGIYGQENSSNLGLLVITNKKIKEIAEEETGKDLTALFNSLQIDYQE